MSKYCGNKFEINVFEENDKILLYFYSETLCK